MTDDALSHRALPEGRHLTYQQRMKYCYRPSCARCRSGTPGHGPYWYVSWREGKRVRSRYLGKQAPLGYAAIPESAQTMASAVVRSGRQPPLRIRTLGRLAVWHGSEPVPDKRWNRKKAGALLGILLSQQDYRLHREQLFELLWPDVSPDVAAGRLWSTLRQLREILDIPDLQGSHLCWRGDQLLLVADEDRGATGAWLDAAAFEQFAASAITGRNIQVCRAAIEAYGDGGDYLPLFPYEDWAMARRDTLRHRLIAVLLHAATLLQEDGLPDEAERYLQRILVVDPIHELAVCALMTLLHVQGRSAEGLRFYRKWEADVREVGLQPEPETLHLRKQLEDALEMRAAAEILPRRSERVPRTNLPPSLSSYVGRGQEQATVWKHLQTSRIVTLTGIGGVGKTRLALAIGSAYASYYQDGVWLAELTALPAGATSADVLLYQTVAKALGVREKAGEPLLHILTEFLYPYNLLLMLDNCEHLIQECAVLVQTLLTCCPQLTVLATSREPLNITGETVWVVPPLTVPDVGHIHPEALARSEAVQLFMARAQAKRPDFALTNSNAKAIAQISHKLEGIPLSLELAAARLVLLSVDQIATRLDDRLRLLTGGSRTALPRHQTLRATLHWSYNLLDEPERVLLRRLSVFAGGCDLDSIEAVCTGDGIERAHVLDVVGSLVSKSLVLAGTPDTQARYRLLDTVRQYGQEHLAAWGEDEAIRECHCTWYIGVAEQAKAHLRSGEQLRWLNRLELEHDNIRAALEWSIAHPSAAGYGLRLASAVWQFWYMRNYQTEGRSWLERVLTASTSGPTALRADVLSAAGGLAYIQNDYERAAALLEESRQCARSAGDQSTEARALLYLANIDEQVGHYAEALAKKRQSLRIFRDRQDLSSVVNALYNMGITLISLEQYEEAQSVLEESLRHWRSMGYELGISMALKNLACISRRQGDLTQAKTAIADSMSHLLESGAHNFKAEALLELGAIAQACGSYDEALGHFQEALRSAVEIQDEAARWEATEGMAWVSVAVGIAQRQPTYQISPTQYTDPSTNSSASGRQALEYAAQLLATTADLEERPRDPWQIAHYDTCLASLRTALGEDVFTRCWASGRRLTREAAIGLALNGPPLCAK